MLYGAVRVALNHKCELHMSHWNELVRRNILSNCVFMGNQVHDTTRMYADFCEF